MRTLTLLLACLSLMAAEWRFDLPAQPAAVARVPVTDGVLAEAGALRLDLARTESGEAEDCWVELRLVARDGRRFNAAAPLRLPGDERRGALVIGLEAGSWSGNDGCLGADVLTAVEALEVRAYGAVHAPALQGRIEVVAAATGSPSFAAQDLGLVRVGPWLEWRLRLAGSVDGERGTLDLVCGDGVSLPCFLDQPGSIDEQGSFHARGPARWVLRLAVDEHPAAPLRLRWRSGNRGWETPINLPVKAASETFPAAPAAALPIPRALPWTADAYRMDEHGWIRIGRTTASESLAPVLAWRADWTGFRGPAAISWIQARALDAAAAAGCVAVDLLPENLGEEHGAFRFGLSPWTGGIWNAPRDLWKDDKPWTAWTAHARQVLARCRAAPGLKQWLIGTVIPANQPDDVARFQRLASAIAATAAALDQRPLLARHPQLAVFARTDPQGQWFSFEKGNGGWLLGPAPLTGTPQIEGGRLVVPILPGEGVRVGGAWVPVDANLFNLDRIEFDVACDGGGEATIFAWVTDHHHRWFQQRLATIPGDGGLQTLGIDCSAGGDWQCAGRPAAWSDEQRRRIRALGIVAYVRGAGNQARLRLDRMRRLGWPRQAEQPLQIQDFQAGSATVDRWQPLRADFRLSLAAFNPYDPDEADVIGEIEGPGGRKLMHPAYWAEPYQLVSTGGVEHAVPEGSGSWHWRYTPPVPGVWRFRIVATLKVQGQVRRAESPWQQVQVAERAGGMPPVNVDARDPRWLATADGAFYYPIGINLRSPGDERQDPNLQRERAMRPVEEEPEAVRGYLSRDWERQGTRAYERWLPIMAANGMNWARVWMCPWWMGLEWRRDWDDYGGLTCFNQANATRMDRVCELAAANHVYLQVELMNHGMVGEASDRQWQDSPYNRRNGGPAARAGDWFRDDKVWNLHEKRLRYTLARWGWCTQIAAWALCSEMEFTGTFAAEAGNDYAHSPSLERWVKRSLEWFRGHDPLSARPVTIHFSHPWSDPELWKTEGLGFSNSNAYTAFQDFDQSLGRGRKVSRNLPLALDAYLNDLFPPDQLKRPTLLGEWGGHWSDNDPQVLHGELRTGVWLQACTPYAGNTGWWWWLWLDITDRWCDYAAVARFVAGEDPRGVPWQTLRPKVLGGHGRAQVAGMRGGDRMRLYAWVKGLDQDHRRRAQGDAGQAVIGDLPPGSRWHWQRWNCSSGTSFAEGEAMANAGGQLSLPLNELAPDGAWKLERLAGVSASPAPEPATSAPASPPDPVFRRR